MKSTQAGRHFSAVLAIVSLIFLVLQTGGCGTREIVVSGEKLRKLLTTAPDGNQIDDLDLIKNQNGMYFIEVRFVSRHVVYVVPRSEVFIEGFADETSPLPMELTVRMMYLREERSPGAKREPFNPYLFR